MHDLAPLTALGATAPREDTIGPLAITEAPDWALASVAARLEQERACADALAGLLGCPAPCIAQHVQGAELGAFWIGAHIWLIEAPYTPDLAQRVKAACEGSASVTDQTDAWVRFDLTGGGIVAVMERLSNLDIAQMQPGQARRSVIEHLGCYVIRHAERLTIYGPRASAQSLHHALLTAAKSAL